MKQNYEILEMPGLAWSDGLVSRRPLMKTRGNFRLHLGFAGKAKTPAGISKCYILFFSLETKWDKSYNS